jgi:glycosyltransferase involved in cell wall biosynthesis
LAASKPVAINYGGWQKEIIESRGIGIVLDSNNYHNAAIELNKFISDKDAVESAGSASEVISRTEFSRELLADKLIKILENTKENKSLQN